jgi:hypothetical protein
MGVPGMLPSLMAFWADPEASAATMEARALLEAKKRGNALVDDPACRQIARTQRTTGRAVLDQRKLPGPDLAGEPGRQTV